jgi:hypothetical protein
MIYMRQGKLTILVVTIAEFYERSFAVENNLWFLLSTRSITHLETEQISAMHDYIQFTTIKKPQIYFGYKFKPHPNYALISRFPQEPNR